MYAGSIPARTSNPPAKPRPHARRSLPIQHASDTLPRTPPRGSDSLSDAEPTIRAPVGFGLLWLLAALAGAVASQPDSLPTQRLGVSARWLGRSAADSAAETQTRTAERQRHRSSHARAIAAALAGHELAPFDGQALVVGTQD